MFAFPELALSSYHVGSRNETQVLRPGKGSSFLCKVTFLMLDHVILMFRTIILG